MRKLILLIILLFPFCINAQHFGKAPKDSKPVKQITEWTTFPPDGYGPEETIKDAVYKFRRDGQLDEWVTNNLDDEIYYYHYDDKQRLKEIEIKNEKHSRKVEYTYHLDRKIAEIKEKDIDLRTVQYIDKKGKTLEEKTFWKGEPTNNRWALMTRKVMNYNAIDSLFGVMEYTFDDNGKSIKLKTIHQFDPIIKKKIKSTYYDAKGKAEKETTYYYNGENQLKTKETVWLKTAEKEKTEYKYKNGKLWQAITTGKDYRYEKVYKNGRYIRYKEYEKGKLLFLTDYQYVFY
ncbi:MAG TPA: hypothetical protein ENJ95_05030 [Bacteroidetes bacterium]|nr:hypothetical protein [Bacteroidota bacterium]